jgi:glycosyltransferase involved in cell wall biosynthesis
MKIVIAVHHFPPRYTGGAEWRAYRTAAALQARGYTPRVVCVEYVDRGPAAGVAWEDEVFKGVPVRRLSFNLEAVPDRFRWEYDNLWIGEHMRQFLAEENPAIFHLIGGYLLSGRVLRVAHELGIPTVVSLTDFWFLCKRISMLRSNGAISTLPINPATCARCLGEEQRRYRFMGKVAPGLMNVFWQSQTALVQNIAARMTFLRETLNQVDTIISPSQFLRNVYVEAGIASDRMMFSRQGRDFQQLDPAMLEKDASPVLRVGYIGQIAPHKGVHLLFDAVRRLPDAALTVQAYGDTTPFPRYTARLQRMIADDERMHLAGVYKRQAVSQVMRDLDVIVVPSLWYENSPNVILEAFAHRTPVMTANLGGMAELVQDGKNGLLFEPGDSASLTRQLRRLLEEPDLLPRLRAGIAPVKSVAEEMDELEEVYRRVRRSSPVLSPVASLKGT